MQRLREKNIETGIAWCVRLALFGAFEAAGYILLSDSVGGHGGQKKSLCR